MARLEQDVAAVRQQSQFAATFGRTPSHTSTMTHLADTEPAERADTIYGRASSRPSTHMADAGPAGRATAGRHADMSAPRQADIGLAAQAARETASNGSSSRWAYWALPLAALAGLGWYFLSGEQSTRQVADAPVATLAGTDSGPAVAPAAGKPLFLAKAPADWVAISTYQNREVFNAAGERLGTASDFFIAPDGRLVASVVGIGRHLGFGEKEIAIPFAATRIVRKDGSWHLVIDATTRDLQRAPAFERGK